MPPENHSQDRNQKVRGQDNVDPTGNSMKIFSGAMTIQPVSIAVMGTTGSGKSTFINLVSGSTLSVSKGLRSCTQKVHWAKEFFLDNRTVQLIDTPGFDDTTKSEVDILKNISAALEDHYKAQARLHGVLYLHRVTDIRMGGASMRSFRLFRKMCGDDSLKNTAIVTTMWDKVAPDEAIPREEELKTDPEFFQPALRQQAKLLRHDNTLESAHQIIREIFANHPSPIDIQVELVEEQKHLSDTNAGKDVKGELDRLTLNFREAITKLQEELQSEPQGEGERELQEQLRLSEMKLKKTMADVKKLKAGYSLRSKVENDQDSRKLEGGKGGEVAEISNKGIAAVLDGSKAGNDSYGPGEGIGAPKLAGTKTPGMAVAPKPSMGVKAPAKAPNPNTSPRPGRGVMVPGPRQGTRLPAPSVLPEARKAPIKPPVLGSKGGMSYAAAAKAAKLLEEQKPNDDPRKPTETRAPEIVASERKVTTEVGKGSEMPVSVAPKESERSDEPRNPTKGNSPSQVVLKQDHPHKPDEVKIPTSLDRGPVKPRRAATMGDVAIASAGQKPTIDWMPAAKVPEAPAQHGQKPISGPSGTIEGLAKPELVVAASQQRSTSKLSATEIKAPEVVTNRDKQALADVDARQPSNQSQKHTMSTKPVTVDIIANEYKAADKPDVLVKEAQSPAVIVAPKEQELVGKHYQLKEESKIQKPVDEPQHPVQMVVTPPLIMTPEQNPVDEPHKRVKDIPPEKPTLIDRPHRPREGNNMPADKSEVLVNEAQSPVVVVAHKERETIGKHHQSKEEFKVQKSVDEPQQTIVASSSIITPEEKNPVDKSHRRAKDVSLDKPTLTEGSHKPAEESNMPGIVTANKQKAADMGITTAPGGQREIDRRAEGIETVETKAQKSSAKHHESKAEIKAFDANMTSSGQKTVGAFQKPVEENKVSNVNTASDDLRPAREADKQKGGSKAPRLVTVASDTRQPPNQFHRPITSQGVGPMPNKSGFDSPTRVTTPGEEPHQSEEEIKVPELVEVHSAQKSASESQQPAQTVNAPEVIVTLDEQKSPHESHFPAKASTLPTVTVASPGESTSNKRKEDRQPEVKPTEQACCCNIQ